MIKLKELCLRRTGLEGVGLSFELTRMGERGVLSGGTGRFIAKREQRWKSGDHPSEAMMKWVTGE